ncbi:MAG: hypothetical protein JOZ82_12765, partial [Marmoricola sp.]|nr:hypothetical protein [Marmoricola sp.]
MHAPVRPVRGRWPSALERLPALRRFFRLDPLVILDDDAEPAQFREAMTSIYVGGTIKITGADRHPETDRLLVDHVDLRKAHIVDIGGSDGSTALDLLNQLDGEFASYTIADLYLRLRAVRHGRRTALFTDDQCVLVVGPRVMAWPQLSRAVGLAYRRTVSRHRSRLAGARTVTLLNPEVRRAMERDDRIRATVHDIFEPWPGETPDVIKVANLLRRLYFDDEDLLRALHVLHDSLPEGGHLMIVDNPRIPNTPPRAGIWRRQGDGMAEVARIG